MQFKKQFHLIKLVYFASIERPACLPHDTLFGETVNNPTQFLDRSNTIDRHVLELLEQNCTNQCSQREVETHETLNEVDTFPLHNMMKTFNISLKE